MINIVYTILHYNQTMRYSYERCHPFYQLINKLTIHSVLIRAIIGGILAGVNLDAGGLSHIAQTILVMIKNLVIKLIDIIIKISGSKENVFYVENIIRDYGN